MKLIAIISLLICILLVACASAKFVYTADRVYPSYKGTVKIFFGVVPENIKYEEIGWVSSKGGTIHQMADLLKAMQKKASKKGANAIVIIDTDKDHSSYLIYTSQLGLHGGSGSQPTAFARAIRIFD